MLSLLIVSYLQFVIMLAELKKGLSLKRKCLCSKTTIILPEWIVPIMCDVRLLHF